MCEAIVIAIVIFALAVTTYDIFAIKICVTTNWTVLERVDQSNAQT